MILTKFQTFLSTFNNTLCLLYRDLLYRHKVWIAANLHDIYVQIADKWNAGTEIDLKKCTAM